LLTLGLDVGTSGLKALVVGAEGEVVAEATAPYAPRSPRPGWSEQNPEDWWRAVGSVCAMLGPVVGDVGAIGLSGQMHGSVFLDGAGTHVGPAILWNDQRTAAECDEIERRTDRRIRDWTLNPPRTAFTASKILWLRNHEPDAFARTRSVLLPKDFVRFRLSGDEATEVTDASGTNLLDVRNRIWSTETLAALEIDPSLLPRVVESVEVTGCVSAGAGAGLLRPGTPIVGGGADQASAAIGNGICEPGVLSITIGTSGVVYAQIDQIVVDPTEAFHTFCHAIPGTWMMMASVLSAAGSFQWYRDTAGAADADAAEAAGRSGFDVLMEGVSATPAGSAGLIFLPYLTGERSPHNDPDARGAWIGLNRRHDRRHLARAVIEGVCFALRDLVDGLAGLGAPVREIRVAGGGAKSALWLQIFASVLGRPVRATTTADASAYGAAMLAAAGASGEPIDALARHWVRAGPLVEPIARDAAIYEDVHAVYRTLYGANRDAMHRLSNLDRATADEGHGR
jgi:xylulokinase